MEELTHGDTKAYTLQACVGKGSYGKVYRAISRAGSPEVVAIKVLPLDDGEQSLSQDMQRELLSLRECEHPCVVRYLDAWLSGDQVWIAMEYCLASTQAVMRLARCALKEEQIAAVCAEALKRTRKSCTVVKRHHAFAVL